MSLHMSGKTQFSAPFVSSEMKLEPAWLGDRGFLEMPYYHILFNRAVDEAFTMIGLGPDHAAQCGVSVLSSEAYVLCTRNLTGCDMVRVTMRILNIDDKRVHHLLELRDASEGWLAASSENLSQHVDLASHEATPFPDAILAKLAVMKANHRGMRLPESTGRVMGLDVLQRLCADMQMSGDRTRH